MVGVFKASVTRESEQGKAWWEMKSESEPGATTLSVTRDKNRETT